MRDAIEPRKVHGDGPVRGNGVRGFTLVELLVALVLTGFLGASLISVLLRQSRFYSTSDEYVYADQAVRAAADLLSVELQMAGPGDLMAAEGDSVSVRFDVYQGVVCEPDALLDAASVFVYDSVTNANLTGGTLGYAVSAPKDSTWTYSDGWSPTIDISGLAKTECTGNGAPDEPESWRYRTLTGWSSSALGGVPERGAVVRKYGRLTYRFDPSTFTSGTALWRNSQELVAPFADTATFRYLLESGDTLASVSGATLDSVVAILAQMTATGEGDATREVARPTEVDIWLRNRR